jgi:hypothetical protein
MSVGGRSLRAVCTVVSIATLAIAARPASATDTTVAPGASLTLSADLVLSDADSLIAGATGGARCTIDGGTHGVTTMPGWTGRIAITSCDVTNLGAAALPAIDVFDAGAGARFEVQDTRFGTSGQITIQSFADMTFLFRGNTIAVDSVVPAELALGDSRPAFHFRGNGGPSQKLFQGNRILRSWVYVEAGQNWLIGGSTPTDGNVIVGVRAGIDVAGSAIVVRGNYVHVTGTLAGWNQIAALYASSEDGTMLVEHNVIRGGNWLVRSFGGGELRYNLLGDPYAIAHVLITPNAKAAIHHNVLVRNNKLMETFYRVSGLAVVNSASAASEHTTSFYGNTIDGSGYCYDVFGRAVAIEQEAFLLNLRNNIFYNLPSDTGASNTAIVGPGAAEATGDPGPPRIGYADYNLFYNPDAAADDNYGVSVEGLAERTSAGFALNDAPVGGAKDAPADPRFTGPLPTVFPFADEAVIAGDINVCQILAFYRGIYTPRADSPAVDHGDPADGTGTDIGAVGAGTGDGADLFGTLCAAPDRVLATLPAVETRCLEPITGGSGTGGTGGRPGHGFVCVCDAGAGDRPFGPLAVLAALALLVGKIRPVRRRLPR